MRGRLAGRAVRCPPLTAAGGGATMSHGSGAAGYRAAAAGISREELLRGAGAAPAPSDTTGDLSQIGGSAAQQLYDDATHGDVTAGDDTFSFQATVAAATAPGSKSLAHRLGCRG